MSVDARYKQISKQYIALQNSLEGGAQDMIVKTLQQLEHTDRHVTSDTWDSIRLLVKDDGLGVSFHISTMHPGHENHLWYKNHLEAVFCIEGEGEVETLDDGKIYPIQSGTIYILDKNDRHILRAKSRMRNACLFSPPLSGKERLDADGCYPREDSYEEETTTSADVGQHR